jgi:hypothetical protein
VKLLEVHASKHVVKATIHLETKKNAYLVAICVKLASMIQIIVLHQKLIKPNSWVNSMILVQKVCKQPQLLSVMIHGTSVVALQVVLLILVSLMMKCTNNTVINV